MSRTSSTRLWSLVAAKGHLGGGPWKAEIGGGCDRPPKGFRVKTPTILIAAAIVAAAAPTPADIVERWYSNRAYPAFQLVLTTMSNSVPLTLFDGVILLVLGLAGLGLIRGLSGRPSRPWRSRTLLVILNLGALVATLYLTFLMTWGLNYRRVPLIQKLDFRPDRVSADRVRALASESAHRLNALHSLSRALHAPPAYSADPALADAFNSAASEFGIAAVAVLPRPKRSMLDGYFRRAGVAGMTDPFFIETLIASDLLPFEWPFVVAHEWSHAAGLADEGEANFAGWLACLHGTPVHQYSGWLFAYRELAASLDEGERGRVAAELDEGPRSDLRAIRERLQAHVSPRVSIAVWRIYDRYLKVNRIPAGTASYSEAVRLMVGVPIGAAPRRLSGRSSAPAAASWTDPESAARPESLRLTARR
jgi:hypothetical protein